MRLSNFSTHVRGLLAVGFLGVMLAFPAPAQAEPNSPTPQTESAPGTGQSEAAPPGETDSGPSGGENGADPANAEAEADPADADPADAEPKSKVVITIDKQIQEMVVWVDGVEHYTWPVSTGLRGYSTPSGTYPASSMNKMWYSKQWDNAPMPHAIFFTKKGHAIHGTLETKRLGSAASHGCVRLDPKNAETLFKLVEEKGLENTEVVLTGVTAGGEAKVASTGKRAKPPRGYNYGYPWFEQRPVEKPRRYGRKGRWFQPYYQAPQGYYQQRRGPYYRGY